MRKNIVLLEILFSVVIIVIMFSIITLICLQIRLELQIINKNSEASLIASNILENMNTRSFENIKKYVDEFSGIGVSKKIEDKLQNIIIFGDEFTEKFFGTEIPNGYTVDFTVQNNLEFDILSDVDISVNYKIGNNDKSVHISTAFEREKITGCNNPILMDDYFTELGITSLNYSITPIKYSKNMNSFVATTKDDQEWYNYSAKKWAKVLVLPNDGDLKKLFIDEHDRISNQVNINGENLNVEDYIYVWIPNFSIKDGVSCFRYGTGKRAIRMSFLYSEGKYLYVNRVSEEVKDISDKCTFDGIYGVWRKLYNEEDEYYKEFNKTRFAPIILH